MSVMRCIDKMKNSVLLTVLSITVCLFAMLFSTAGYAAQEQNGRQIVKVGYFFDSDFMNKSTDGIYGGYNVEYFYELLKYTNWQYEFVDFNGFDEAMTALEAGQIDVVPAVFYSEDRARRFLLSDGDMGNIFVTLIVREGDTAHPYNDYASFQGMKVGILAGSLDGERFREWSAAKGIAVDIIPVKSEKELLQSLDDGRFDAVAITYLGASSSYRIVAEFNPMTMRMAMPKDRTELMKQMNEAMEGVYINNPSFQTSLYYKYFAVNQTKRPVFTLSEQQYIQRGETVRVTMQLDNPPFSYEDSRGQIVGALPDLYEWISRLSGLKFTFVPVGSMDEAMTKVEQGEADVIAKITNDSRMALSHHILLTKDYMDLSLAQVTRKGTTRIHKIGIPVSLVTVFSQRPFPVNQGETTVIHYPNNAQCFKALQEGTVDAVFMNEACLNYHINSNRASDYTVTALSEYDYKIAAGVLYGGNDALYGIMNKCFRFIGKSTLDELILKYAIAGDTSFGSFINRIPSHIIIAAVVFLIGVVVALIVLILLLIRSSRAKQALHMAREKTQQQEEELRIIRKTNADKMEFFGNISHDMRTPLNGILGYTALALVSNEIAAMKTYLQKIKISGGLLLDLVNDTLTLSRIENKKFVLNQETISAEAMLQCIVVPIQAAAAAKQIQFDVQAAECSQGYVYVDKLNLQKIFLNLLSNAVKFTPPGGKVEWIVEAVEPDSDLCNCKVTVRDSGIGISPEFLPKIFDAFAQEHPLAAENISGTGLGLSIVKHLVEAMGGKIAVTSEKGKGTEFTVWLPIKQVEHYEAISSDEMDTASLAGKTILVCEDNIMNMEILSSILEQKNMHVLSAANGKEGVELFSQSKEQGIAAVLMDIRMPIMDGYAAAAAIRTLPRVDAATVPIVAVSADAYAADMEKSRAAGMNAHLAKPIDPVKLFQVLVEVME